MLDWVLSRLDWGAHTRSLLQAFSPRETGLFGKKPNWGVGQAGLPFEEGRLDSRACLGFRGQGAEGARILSSQGGGSDRIISKEGLLPAPCLEAERISGEKCPLANLNLHNSLDKEYCKGNRSGRPLSEAATVIFASGFSHVNGTLTDAFRGEDPRSKTRLLPGESKA